MSKRSCLFVCLAISVLLCACAPSSGNVEMSREEYEKLLAAAEENNKKEEPTPTPTETPTPEPSEEGSAEKQDEIADIDITSDEWMLLDFKKPDAQIPVPSYVKDWEHVFPDKKQHTYDYESKDGVHLRIEVGYVFENGVVEPENDEEYKELYNRGECLEWSHKDHLIKECYRCNGEDQLCARYWGDGYFIDVMYSVPEGKIEDYRDVYESTAQYLSKVEVKTYHVMTEDEMINRCKEISGAPIAEIDDIVDIDEYLIRCYEQIGEGDEYHEPTWAWYRVNPIERTAIDDVTGEEVKGFFD